MSTEIKIKVNDIIKFPSKYRCDYTFYKVVKITPKTVKCIHLQDEREKIDGREDFYGIYKYTCVDIDINNTEIINNTHLKYLKIIKKIDITADMINSLSFEYEMCP